MNCKIETTPDFARELKQLATIYDKSDQANITDKELKKLIKKNGLE